MWRSFGSDRRGAVAVLAAIGGALACVVAGVAVDAASVAFQARRYQAAADLAALSAAMNLDRAEAAAAATGRTNAPQLVAVSTRIGRYDGDASRTASDRFVEGGPVATANAARVTIAGPANLFFGRIVLGRETVDVTRTATAVIPAPTAMFSIGSRLARLEGGLANAVLGGLLGSEVSLTVMDYEALADADVSLLEFADALAVRAGIEAGDYQGLLDATVTTGDGLGAMEALVGNAQPGLQKLIHAATDADLRVGDLIGTELTSSGDLRAGLEARVSALDLATAMIEIGGGERQMRLETGARAGLADLDVWLAIGERPNRSAWLTVSDRHEPVIRTAQARLYVQARTTSALSGVSQVNLPILVDLASSEASLSSLRCAPAREVTLAVRPGVARLRIGSVDTSRLDDFKSSLTTQPATLASVAGLVTVTGSADMEMASPVPRPVVFDDRAITDQTRKTVASSGYMSSAVSSLLQRLNLQVRTLGLGLGLGDLSAKTSALLAPLGPVLDALVEGVLEPLGLSLGEADVTVHGASCRAMVPRLVS